MLTKKQLQEIKNHLEQAQNPLFFFDNDVDGLCSFLILQRAIGRGKGVAIKSFPDLNKNYLRRINELNPDYIFILDKAEVSEEFINGVHEKAIPIVWIDHHNVKIKKKLLEKVDYFNSYPSSEPVTYIAYNIFKRKEDMWLAIIGCIGDVYMPNFAHEFSKKYPELFNANLSAFDSLYATEIGKLVKMLNFGLMDTTTNVVRLMKYLIKAKNVYDILEENQYTKQFHHHYKQLNKEYQKLIFKAESQFDEKSKLILFEYAGAVSMSSGVANALYFKHKDKIIAVVFKRQDKASFSIRGDNILKLTLKIVKSIEGATGGGHQNACGDQVPIDKLEEFKSKIKRLVKSEYEKSK